MNTDFYTAFGAIACVFSQMESDLRSLISGLAFKGDFVAASPFLDNMQLSKNLEVLKKLSLRLDDDLEEELKSIVKRVSPLRETRNLFIHGLWNPGDFGPNGGKAHVSNMKTTHEKLGKGSGTLWNSATTYSYSVDEFRKVYQDVCNVCTKIELLFEKLKKEDEEYNFGHGEMIRLTESTPYLTSAKPFPF